MPALSVARRGVIRCGGGSVPGVESQRLEAWSTTSTITVAQPASELRWDVTYLRRPVASWGYRLTELDGGRTAARGNGGGPAGALAPGRVTVAYWIPAIAQGTPKRWERRCNGSRRSPRTIRRETAASRRGPITGKLVAAASVVHSCRGQ